MTIAFFPAIVERGEAGVGVIFPDPPGCATMGDTIQEAARNAEQVLADYLVAMADHGYPIPEPGTLDAIEPAPVFDEAARILVRAELPGR